MNLKKLIQPTIILILLLSTGYLLYDKFSTEEINYSEKQEKINALQRDLEKIFIEKKNIELSFDSAEAASKLIASERKENKGDWNDEIKKAEKKCDPKVIHKLDSIFIKSDSLCNTSLAAKDVQIFKLRSELKLDTIAFLKHDSIQDKYVDIILDYEESLKKGNRISLSAGPVIGNKFGFPIGAEYMGKKHWGCGYEYDIVRKEHHIRGKYLIFSF